MYKRNSRMDVACDSATIPDTLHGTPHALCMLLENAAGIVNPSTTMSNSEASIVASYESDSGENNFGVCVAPQTNTMGSQVSSLVS
jgi:hypothetical protein